MMYMAHLDANVIAEINLNDDMDEENHKEAEPGTCNSSHCRLVLSGMSLAGFCNWPPIHRCHIYI